MNADLTWVNEEHFNRHSNNFIEQLWDTRDETKREMETKKKEPESLGENIGLDWKG